MDAAQFDDVLRRLRVDRRAAIILLVGGVVGLNTSAGARNKKSNKDKGKHDAKACRKEAKACVAFAESYCSGHLLFDEGATALCRQSIYDCCGLYHECETSAGDACMRAVPY